MAGAPVMARLPTFYKPSNEQNKMSTFDEILNEKLQTPVPVKGKETMIDPTEAMVNAQPDFTGMGLEPEKRKNPLKDFIEDIPYWIEFLPEDWTGDSERALITLTMSKAAVNNEEFDFDGYFSKKILLALGKIKSNHNLKKVSLSPKNKIIVDISRDIEKVYFYIHVEYAKL